MRWKKIPCRELVSKTESNYDTEPYSDSDALSFVSLYPSSSPLRVESKGKMRDSEATDGALSTPRRSSKFEYIRIGRFYDRKLRDYKIHDTVKVKPETEYDDAFCFLVERMFDNEAKFQSKVVKVQSKLLRECLQEVIGNIKGVRLVDETPILNPNLLFL